MIGIAGTIVFGVWLAISLDRLPAVGRLDDRGARPVGIAGWLGDQSGKAYAAAGTLARSGPRQVTRRAPSWRDLRDVAPFWLHTASFVVILLILVDMIWKPGA